MRNEEIIVSKISLDEKKKRIFCQAKKAILDNFDTWLEKKQGRIQGKL